MERFGIGQAVRRHEDERFLTGSGQYLDDITLQGMVHSAVVRSPYAHARIVSIRTDEAEGAPGVIAVYTAADYMESGYGPFPTLTEVAGIDEHGVRHPERHALASGTVHFVGDAVRDILDPRTRRASLLE